MKHLFTIGLMFIATTLNAKSEGDYYYLKLKDKLDRPVDGYCLDVTGNGRHVRFDIPLNAHNCKEESDYVYPDETVQFREDGTLLFPAYNLCVTVMGLNQHALPYNSLMVKQCEQNTPFLNAQKFQKFKFNENDQIQLVGSNLCITAGDVSKVTYSKKHKWRSLYMQECNVAKKSHSSWFLEKK